MKHSHCKITKISALELDKKINNYELQFLETNILNQSFEDFEELTKYVCNLGYSVQLDNEHNNKDLLTPAWFYLLKDGQTICGLRLEYVMLNKYL